MYGKHFTSMYEGSMVGAGAHVFAVWGYCIANADQELHTVRLNPALLSVILGEPVERIEAAIQYLAAPDSNSVCPDEDGRRLLHTTGFEYLVVTHEQYREIKSSADRRAYMRKYMRDYRKAAKDKSLDGRVNNCKHVNTRKLTSASASDSDFGSDPEYEKLIACAELAPLTKEQWLIIKRKYTAISPAEAVDLIIHEAMCRSGGVADPAAHVNRWYSIAEERHLRQTKTDVRSEREAKARRAAAACTLT
jgi:hypothetical protein